MNTNSNIYTVVYTTLVCVFVAAVLAFVSQILKPKQEENEKAETISQILTAAKFGEKKVWEDKGNNATVNFYIENIAEAFIIDLQGNRTGELDTRSATVYTVPELKAQNYNIKKAAAETALPVYIFKNGITVIPVYGAGLWGPVWGYLAIQPDLKTLAGAYFDHESETPGLGGKIKDDPSFRAEFEKEILNIEDASNPFDIVKGGSPEGVYDDSKVDAITGATMTSKGLDAAIDSWVGSYSSYLAKALSSITTAEETSNE